MSDNSSLPEESTSTGSREPLTELAIKCDERLDFLLPDGWFNKAIGSKTRDEWESVGLDIYELRIMRECWATARRLLRAGGDVELPRLPERPVMIEQAINFYEEIVRRCSRQAASRASVPSDPMLSAELAAKPPSLPNAGIQPPRTIVSVRSDRPCRDGNVYTIPNPNGEPFTLLDDFERAWFLLDSLWTGSSGSSVLVKTVHKSMVKGGKGRRGQNEGDVGRTWARDLSRLAKQVLQDAGWDWSVEVTDDKRRFERR